MRYTNLMKSLEELIASIAKNKDISVQKTRYNIKGAALYSTAHFPDDSYYKVAFENHVGLLIVPSINQIFFTTSLETAKGISDEQVGTQEVEYGNKTYHAVNANDYQFVRKIISGSPSDIEGECAFSDYEDEGTPPTMLSLGWISYTKKRADVFAKQISLSVFSECF